MAPDGFLVSLPTGKRERPAGAAEGSTYPPPACDKERRRSVPVTHDEATALGGAGSALRGWGFWLPPRRKDCTRGNDHHWRSRAFLPLFFTSGTDLAGQQEEAQDAHRQAHQEAGHSPEEERQGVRLDPFGHQDGHRCAPDHPEGPSHPFHRAHGSSSSGQRGIPPASPVCTTNRPFAFPPPERGRSPYGMEHLFCFCLHCTAGLPLLSRGTCPPRRGLGGRAWRG